jgi:RimJ/RimL family protein N-acetyltransferase
MFPAIDTPRLRLRRPVDTDAASLFAIFSDPSTMLYWSRPAMTSVSEAAMLVKDIESHAAAGTLYQWGLARREDDVVIGTATLFRIDREHRRAEVGYILRRDHWGRGLANEALAAIIRHAFDTLDLHRLEADIDPRNAASIRSIERLGFKCEGHLKERYFVAGDIQDSLMYGLLASQWRAR